LPPFDDALRKIVETIKTPEMGITKRDLFYIGLDGSFGENAISPRHLGSRLLGRMISIEGIITKCIQTSMFIHRLVYSL
jgi:DNA replication licensing factor MCM3